MPLTVEAEITPGMSVREVVELARMVEDAGFDRLGVSDVVLWQDCFVLLGIVAHETSRIGIGPMVTNPYTRHPAVLAGIAATLHDASGGRFFLGIGAGAGLEVIGGCTCQPVTHLRECVETVRALLEGRTVDYEGETVSLHGARLQHGPAHVPISIGTRSPQVMRLAGEVADIVLVGGRYLSPALAGEYRTWIAEGVVRAGRSASSIEVAPRVTLCTSDDGGLARRSVKRYVAHYAALIRPTELGYDDAWYARVEAALARSTGWYFQHDRYDDPEIFALIPDSLVRKFAIAGTPSECREIAEEILDLGFTSISMNLSFAIGANMYRGLADTIAGFGSVLGELRASRG